MNMTTVYHQGHRVPESMVELYLKVCISILKYMCSDTSDLFFLTIIVYMKMISFHYTPIKLFILYLISPKIELGLTYTRKKRYNY